uniref:Nucleolar RNA helicase 2 n=1 Tax=Otolemur garnettii TaxID=30611 RepID=H0WJG8_OTOGA
MPGRLLGDADLESDATVKKVEMLRKQAQKKERREKPKSSKTEEAAEEEETISPKAKQVKKKASTSEVDINSPKSKKAKKKEEQSQDDIVSPKTKSVKKKKEPLEKKVVSPKIKNVRSEEPSEVDDAPKPKRMKKEKEVNGEIVAKTPELKNGFSHSEPDSNSVEAASEESNSEIEQDGPGLLICKSDVNRRELCGTTEKIFGLGTCSSAARVPATYTRAGRFKSSLGLTNDNDNCNQRNLSYTCLEIYVIIPFPEHSDFLLSNNTVNLFTGRGVTFLFPIQARTFHHVYSGKDLIAQARTGTGKTFSFAIPLIEKLQGELQDRKRGRSPQVLVLAPTRELANQVSKDFSDITKKLAVACFYGGTPYGGQIERMRNGIDILVGTPGRIKDHLQNGKLDLTKLKHVVLDEVDQMLDMGFADQVEDILSVAYKKEDSEDNPQTLLFSATCPHWVFNVAKKYMKPTYEQVDLIGKKTQKTAITVEHLAIKCHWTQRAAVIGDVIRVYSGHQGRTIIFCETKKDAQELSQNTAIKQDAQSLHGDIPQKQREITLKGFRNGAFGVLVATNVAARGLDIPEVDLVVQSCPPKDVESYIHRSGRTGRAGRTGVCICFYQHKEEYQLVQVEQKAGIKFKRIGVPSPTEIIKASSKDAIRLLDSVPPTAINHFKESAEKLIEEKGAVEALAAALAHISGATSVDQRSLINSDVGFVTMILRCSIEMPNISYAWKELKEQLGEDIDSKVKGMVFLKGKLGVCFDIPTASVTEIQEKWHDSRRWQLAVATEQPELEGPKEGYRAFRGQREGNRNFRGRREGNRNFRGQRSGGGNRSNRSQNKGQKRSFNKAFSK